MARGFEVKKIGPAAIGLLTKFIASSEVHVSREVRCDSCQI